MSEKPAKKRGLPVWAWVLIVGAVLVVPAVMAAMVVVIVPMVQEKAQVSYAKQNLRVVATILVDRRTREGHWPAYSGKNFVLSVLLAEGYRSGEPGLRDALFSPGDVMHGPEDADPGLYGDVTKEALAAGEDFTTLTSFAGRRNADPRFALPPDAGGKEPILADTSFRGIVLIAYADGSVREHSYESLALERSWYEPGTFPIGDAAPAGVLRKLSDE